MLTVDTKILNSKWEKKPGESEKTEVFLNNEDQTFKEIRDLHNTAIGVVTGPKLVEIERIKSEKDNPQNITELSKYIKKVKAMNIPKLKE